MPPRIVNTKRSIRPRRKMPRKMQKGGLANKVMKLERSIRRGFERKVFNSGYSSAMSTSFNVWNPFEVVQGDLASNRNGNEVYLKHMHLRMAITANANGVTGENFIRVVIVQHLQQVPSVAISGSDVFLQNTNANSVYNFPTNNGLFAVLFDKTLPVIAQGLTYNSGNITLDYPGFIELDVIPKERKITWNGATGTSYQKNHIYVLVAYTNSSWTCTPAFTAQTVFYDN